MASQMTWNTVFSRLARELLICSAIVHKLIILFPLYWRRLWRRRQYEIHYLASWRSLHFLFYPQANLHSPLVDFDVVICQCHGHWRSQRTSLLRVQSSCRLTPRRLQRSVLSALLCSWSFRISPWTTDRSSRVVGLQALCLQPSSNRFWRRRGVF